MGQLLPQADRFTVQLGRIHTHYLQPKVLGSLLTRHSTRHPKKNKYHFNICTDNHIWSHFKHDSLWHSFSVFSMDEISCKHAEVSLSYRYG